MRGRQGNAASFYKVPDVMWKLVVAGTSCPRVRLTRSTGWRCMRRRSAKNSVGRFRRADPGGMPEQPMPRLGFPGPEPVMSTQASPLALIVAA